MVSWFKIDFTRLTMQDITGLNMRQNKRLKKWLKDQNKTNHEYLTWPSHLEKRNKPHLFYSDTLKCAKEIIKHSNI